MLHWMSLALVMAFLPSLQASPLNVVEENLYYSFQTSISSQKQLKQKSLLGFSSFEQSLFVDALEDLAEEGSPAAINLLDEEVPLHYDLVQKLRLGILRIKHNLAPHFPASLENEITNALQSPSVDLKIIYLIAAYQAELIKSGHHEIVALAKKHPQFFDIVHDQETSQIVSDEIISDLFNASPDITTYMNGEYVKSVKIFMFCRANRLYPCLMVMKNVHGEPVRIQDGSLWSNPALASSSRGLPSYSRNGNTPEGILTIDSVMPYADQQISFGKYRRMILNFVPKSRDEALTKSLLPTSSYDSDWWKSASVSRDIGRNLLRIHGTGKLNVDPETPYYPFMRTSGCIAQRENTYESITYQDQRDLLDSIMKAMDLATVYQNETSIKGILYLMEIDDMNAPVTLQDLALRGVE